MTSSKKPAVPKAASDPAQSREFIRAAQAAEADENPAAFEARLKAVAKHQPPLVAIKAAPKARRSK